jgi:Lrp/AsnC family transcriptional regulator for asnA, asnC and gidA
MIKIDVKDKKILYYLLQDSRQSFKILGKTAGVSSDFVSYRIKRLIDKEIINNFTIQISEEKLGYGSINLYFKFANISPKIKDEIISYFVYHKLTRYVSSLEGIYDFQVQLFMGDPLEFEAILDEIKNKFHKYLLLKFATSWIRGESHKYLFLLDDPVNEIEPVHWNWGHSLTPIDNLDFKILSELAKDSRTQTKIIANKLDSTVSIINYRIKKLTKQGVIVGYTINVNWSKIGYRWFHLRINLGEYDKKNQIMKHIRENPNLIAILKGLITNVDIHCTYLLKNAEELRKIIEELTSKFPNLITNYEFYSTYKIYKLHYMIPKLLDVRNPFNRGRTV